MFDIDALTDSIDSNPYEFSAGYNSGGDDGEVILPFPSKYPDLSNPDVHVDFEEFIHPTPPTDPPTLTNNSQRTTFEVNTIEELLGSGDLIIDEVYNYFHNFPHETDPSIRANKVQDISFTYLGEDV